MTKNARKFSTFFQSTSKEISKPSYLTSYTTHNIMEPQKFLTPTNKRSNIMSKITNAKQLSNIR